MATSIRGRASADDPRVILDEQIGVFEPIPPYPPRTEREGEFYTLGDGEMFINIGPQHPSTHGVLRIMMELDGETVLRAKPIIGYLHTGMEKQAEYKTYTQSIPQTDRMDYLSPMSNNLALCLHKLGRPADALPLVTRLVQEHPDFAETWLLLGRTQYLQNQPGAAEQSFRRFLQMDSESVNGHFQLGMSLLAQKRYPEAVATFRHATSLKRDFGPAFFNLGFALAKSGQEREAIPAFQEAIRHNPEIIDSYILLADLHLQLGEKPAAAELAKLAERLNPNDPRLPTLRRKLEQK